MSECARETLESLGLQDTDHLVHNVGMVELVYFYWESLLRWIVVELHEF